MQTNKILSADFLDILFDGRNKEYGAYELRHTYSKRITKAMLITGSVTLMILAGSVFAKNSKTVNRNVIIHPVVDISSIKEKPEVIEPKKPEVKPQVRTEQFTAKIEIKPDNEVKQPPPTQEALAIANIGAEQVDGKDPDGLSRPNEIDGNKGVIEEKETKEPVIYTRVEVDAKFSGNWQKFLERNLNPEVPVDNNAPNGNYTIEVQFVVDTLGNVSDIKPLTNIGYGMEQEAVRVLKKATKWEPAFQNGHQVKAYRRQRIIFQVLGE